MYEIVFTPQSQKELILLTRDEQGRILKKLKFFAQTESPLYFSKPLVNFPPSTHRFRVGNYRIAFHIIKTVIYINKIGHRSQIYK